MNARPRRTARRSAVILLFGAFALGCATRPARFPTLSAPPDVARPRAPEIARDDESDDQRSLGSSSPSDAPESSDVTLAATRRVAPSHTTALAVATRFRSLLSDSTLDVDRVLTPDAKLSGFDGSRGRSLRNVLRDRRADLRPSPRPSTSEPFDELLVEPTEGQDGAVSAVKWPQKVDADVLVRVRPLVGGGARDGLRPSWFLLIRATQFGQRVVEVRTHDGLLPER